MTTTIFDNPRIDVATLLHEDLERLMPGCDVLVERTAAGGCIATATDSSTGRTMRVHVGPTYRAGPDEWVVLYEGASTIGRSAYGFDSAVIHGYRHYLDFTSEYGPGTAHDYAERGRA